MEIRIMFIIVIALLTVITAVLIYHEYAEKRREVNKVEKENQALRENVEALEVRMEKLEAANRKRMPYEAMEDLLNARAALDREKEEHKFFVSLIENAEAHIEKAMTTGTKKGK